MENKQEDHNSISYEEYFMRLAETVAIKSKDQMTKLGAVIVGPDNEIRNTGFNSFPRGINDYVQARQERPEKYKWFEHAERNAIYCAARQGGAGLKGCTLYCRWLPCSDCARAIISVGIIQLVVKTFEIPERWVGDMSTSITMLKEAGIKIKKLGDMESTDWDSILKQP